MKFDERLAALREAVADASTKGARTRVVNALKGKNGLLVSVACEAARDDVGLRDLLPDAFDRLMVDAVKRDPQCQGKAAIARCLREADDTRDAVFLAGARYVQHEPVWGGRVDTAAALRGVCVMALVEQQHPKGMVAAAQLLADPEAAARTAAARAIGASGNPAVGEPLLTLRATVGDEDPNVLGECFGALLSLAPSSSIDFVAQRLRHEDETVAEAAALALGESRRPEALGPLCAQVEQVVFGARRRVLMLAIAMLRSEDAWARLLEWIAEGPRGEALEALRALGTFSHDAKLGQRVRAAVTERSDDALDATMAELFAPAEVR